MAPAVSREWPASVSTAARLVTFAIVCALLYWGQVVLVPIALAAFLTFLVAPVVRRLDHVGVPRVAGVLIVLVCATGVVGGLGYLVIGQLSELAMDLPKYRENIRDKLDDAQNLLRGGAIESVQTTINDIAQEVDDSNERADQPQPESVGPQLEPQSEPQVESQLEPQVPPQLEPQPDPQQREPPMPSKATEPVQVEVVPSRPLFGDAATWSPALESLATLGITVLLAIFMLVRREDLRNRLVSLAGETSVVGASKAMADAGQRVSRYLLMQFIVNVTMGVAVGLGLFVLDVQYAALWGLAAGVLRYIPYLGPWLAALLPITLTLVQTSGWEQVLLVIGLFAVLELLSNNFMEPWLYGQSVGLSTISVVVSAIFWTWLWGPIGLVLATPLTVCLVVFARYVPELAIFDRLLSDRPARQSHLWLYQRLLSHDEEEAEEIIHAHLKEHSLAETCDQLLLEVLVAVKRDLAAGRITLDEGDFVANALNEMVDDLPNPPGETAAEPPPGRERALIVGFPASNRFDDVALGILAVLLRNEPVEFVILPPERLVGERVAEVESRRPTAVCICSLPPGDLTATRHALKRLRARMPNLKLLVGRLGAGTPVQVGTDPLRAAGAHQVTETFTGLRDAVASIVRARPLESRRAREVATATTAG